MDARDEETGEAMNDTQLRDEVMTLFARRPMRKRQPDTLAFTHVGAPLEASRWCGGSCAPRSRPCWSRAVTALDLPKLTYTRMVVEESMRLYPPAWLFGRLAIAEDEIRGVRIPPGSMVILSPFFTHRHPSFWSNPEGFDPERFADVSFAPRHNTRTFPFQAAASDLHQQRVRASCRGAGDPRHGRSGTASRS